MNAERHTDKRDSPCLNTTITHHTITAASMNTSLHAVDREVFPGMDCKS